MQKKHGKKLRKIATVILAMMFCFMGCTSKDTGGVKQNETVTETVSMSAKDMTVEEMLKHIKLYGEEVSLPCKVSDLPKTVTVGSGYTFSDGGAISDGGAVFDLLHNGEKIGSIHLGEMHNNEFKEVDMSSEYENEIITALTLSTPADGVNCFDIVGITGYDTKKDVLEKLGEPTIKDEHDYTYEYTNNGKLYGLTFLYDTDDVMGLFMVGITNEREKETTK